MEIPKINKRIRQIIDYYTNGVVKKFAENIDIQQQTLNRLFVIDKRIGKYPIATTEILQKISEMYDINPEWLLTGKGNMFKKNDEKSVNQSIVGDNNKMAGNEIIDTNNDISNLLQKVKHLEKQLEQKDDTINKLVEQQNKLISKLINQ